MSELHEDLTMRFITWSVRSMYVFAVGYFAQGFWSAREVFYSPPLDVLVVAYVGLLCIVTMLGLFGIFLFAKLPGVALAKIFFLRKRECMGGNEQ